MSKKIGRILFLNDRDIYDGLRSSQKQVTPNLLREFLLDRGLFLSENLSRERLIEYVSSLNLDYHDLQLLIEQLSTSSKKEKVRMVDLDCIASKQEIREIFEKVKDQRSDKYEETYLPQILGNEEKVSMNVEYQEIDLSKTRLRQRREKEANIEAEIIGDGKIRIRFPDNERAEEIVDLLKEKIKIFKNAPVNESVIDLSGIVDFKLRSQFFMEMIKNMDKSMTLYDVTRVSVESRLYDDNEDEYDEQTNSESDSIAKNLVHKALLSGNSVLTSKACRDLMDAGFYIYRLAWLMKEKGAEGAKFEFEAFFSDAPSCKKFSCLVCGMYPVKGDGFTISRRKIPASESSLYLSILEKAASAAYAYVLNENSNDRDDKK